MPDFTVSRYGTDSSGRGIFATAYMAQAWRAVLDSLPFGDRVVITQGAFMVRNGGGASASAGYHDAGGTFDLRVWNLTDAEVAELIRALRAHGFAAWLRNNVHGGFTDPHIHLVLGSDSPLSTGAAYQWRDYLAGGDGMGGRDYHPRPNPLVTTPPPTDWFDMATEAELRKIVREEVDALLSEVQANGKSLRENIRKGGLSHDFAKEIAAEVGAELNRAATKGRKA